MCLKEKLINNTKIEMEKNSEFSEILVEYNRRLFKELFDLDLFFFIDKKLVEEYLKKR